MSTTVTHTAPPTVADASGLTVRRVAGNIGAELGGIRLSGDLDDATVAHIRAQLLEHKVVFFRGQHHLDEDTQAAFAARFGPLTTAHPTVPSLDQHPEVLDLDSTLSGGRANSWHTDVTFVDRPPAFSVLRAVTVPEVGGDTMWANTAAAYRNLPAELRELADRLWAVHSNEFDYARLGVNRDGVDPARAAYAEVFASEVYETLHPVVRVHPETGERALLLGGFARQIAGLSSSESAALLRAFADRVTTPEHVVRWAWAEGDVAIWDNRATQHYAIADYDAARIVRRITVVGDLPVGVNGETSVARKGDATAYYQAA